MALDWMNNKQVDLLRDDSPTVLILPGIFGKPFPRKILHDC